MFLYGKLKKKKEPSLRESMLGKSITENPQKKEHALPKNFFEKMLNCEIKLRAHFSMEVLQELVNFYSTAIEYYESIDDPRYKQYNQNLNLLFTQPQVIRAMNINKYRKLDRKNEIESQLEQTEKTISKQNITSLIQSNHKQNSTLTDLINTDISTQQSQFEQRKAAKKKKYLLSTSDITDAIETMKNKRKGLGIMEDNQNKSVEYGSTPNENIFDNDNNNTHVRINSQENIKSELRITNKTKLKDKMKINMDIFLNEYTEYYTNKLINSITNDCVKLYEEYETKENEIATDYAGQIKETEFLLVEDANINYKEGVKKIIFQLKKEEKNKQNKLQQQYEDKVNDIVNKYTQYQNRDSGIKLIEEKFRLDICNTISNEFIK